MKIIKGDEFNPLILKEGKEKEMDKIEKEVEEIIRLVKEKGDEALYELSLKFDNFDIRKNGLKISVPDKVEVSSDFASAIDLMIKRVQNFYSHEYKNSWFYTENGSLLGQMLVPMERVLLYVPGGKASYPSTVVMGTIPAKIAGVKEIYITTPPSKRDDKNLLYTLNKLGIKELYLLGGAHAIAAFSYGTYSVPKVDMIIGPGNLYVAIAKKKVFGDVNIDGIFGPSEVCVWLKSEDIDIDKVVCDFLAQLEHSPFDRGWLILEEKRLNLVIEKIEDEVNKSLRRDILEKSIKNAYIIVEEREEKAIEIINTIAPEHLEIIDPNGERFLPYIKSAGAIFINQSSIFGDFIAGPNHILPTGGSARFSSGLNVNMFLKRISFVKLTDEDKERLSYFGSIIAREEGFDMHEKSLKNYYKEGD